MRKSVAIGMALLGILALGILTPTVQASHIYVAQMASDGDGIAFARASGGASCYINAAARWTVVDANNVQLGVDFAPFTYITGSIWMRLEAPGWGDESYFNIKVYHDGALMGETSGSWSGDPPWQGYQQSGTFLIGPGGDWKWVVSVWGLDWGSLTCQATKTFRVYDI